MVVTVRYFGPAADEAGVPGERIEIAEGATLGAHVKAILAAVPHRGEALAACRHAIDTLKSCVPIRKKEIRRSGASAWVEPERGA